MARLSRERVATLTVQDEEVKFHFREPSNKEINEFLSSRWKAGKKGRVDDNSHDARCEFFDRLLVKVENLEDPDGNPVTPERKELIPGNWKSDMVFKLFEDAEIDIKN